jgi:gluconokinase
MSEARETPASDTPPRPPLIVTLDVGSSSVRALGFDAAGRALPGECQLDYEPDTTADGGVEADPERLLQLTAEALDGLLGTLGPRAGAVAAVAVSTFWHTVLESRRRASAHAVYPGPTRGARRPSRARDRVDEGHHARTGCVLAPRICRRGSPGSRSTPAFAASRCFLSFGEYLHLALRRDALQRVDGLARSSSTSIARKGRRDPEAVAFGERLAPLADLDAPLSGSPQWAARWPARPGAGSALGDGACSNVGAGCIGPDRSR